MYSTAYTSLHFTVSLYTACAELGQLLTDWSTQSSLLTQITSLSTASSIICKQTGCHMHFIDPLAQAGHLLFSATLPSMPLKVTRLPLTCRSAAPWCLLQKHWHRSVAQCQNFVNKLTHKGAALFSALVKTCREAQKPQCVCQTNVLKLKTDKYINVCLSLDKFIIILQ